MDNLETLLESKELPYKERWHPKALDNYKKIIEFGCLKNLEDEIRRNIAYSLQYLEFLELQLQEFHLQNVIEKMIYKSYIITSVSIIEAIFDEIVKFNNCYKKENWKVIKEIGTNNYKLNGKEYKMNTIVFQKLETPIDGIMKFEEVFNQIQKKKLLNLIHSQLHPLKRFYKLRNHVHLTKYEEGRTNWHEFKREDYVIIKFLLQCILRDKKLENKKYVGNCLDFLDLSDDEQRIVAKLNNKRD